MAAEAPSLQPVIDANPDLHATLTEDPEAGYQVWAPGDTEALAAILSPAQPNAEAPGGTASAEHAEEAPEQIKRQLIGAGAILAVLSSQPHAGDTRTLVSAAQSTWRQNRFYN